MATRILCLGNELICDDAVGIRLGRLLDEVDLPPDVVVETKPSIGLDLIDVLSPGERLIIADATKTGSSPGTCSSMVWEEVESAAVELYCCHGLGIAEAMKLCRLVAPDRIPEQVTLIGLEGEIFDRFGLEMSPAVRRSFPHFVGEVLRAARVPDACLRQALALAHEHLDVELERVCSSPY